MKGKNNAGKIISVRYSHWKSGGYYPEGAARIKRSGSDRGGRYKKYHTSAESF